MKTKPTSDETVNQNAFPQGRWSSIPVKFETLGFVISADEIKRRAVEQLVKQAKREEAV